MRLRWCCILANILSKYLRRYRTEYLEGTLTYIDARESRISLSRWKNFGTTGSDPGESLEDRSDGLLGWYGTIGIMCQMGPSWISSSLWCGGIWGNPDVATRIWAYEGFNTTPRDWSLHEKPRFLQANVWFSSALIIFGRGLRSKLLYSQLKCIGK